MKPRVFIIGYNRTGTTSLHHLFLKDGYVSWHCVRPMGGHIGRQLHTNMENDRPILEGLEDADVLCDLLWAKRGFFFEGTHAFKRLHDACPNAYFILNTRSMDTWIKSRVKHKRGDFMARAKKFYKTKDDEKVKEIWREERDKWEHKIRQYFSLVPDARFLEFNIETDDINKVIDFVHPDFKLHRYNWGHKNKTAH